MDDENYIILIDPIIIEELITEPDTLDDKFTTYAIQGKKKVKLIYF